MIDRAMRIIWLCLALVSIVVYSHAPKSSGGLYLSSCWESNDNYDHIVWDEFTLQENRSITEISWRGGYEAPEPGSGGPVLDFTIAIYPSISSGSQPDVIHPPLVEYKTKGKAGETLAGTFGGLSMYDYLITLTQPFEATAGKKYWLMVHAWQNGIPNWGMAAADGGNGSHFRQRPGQGDVDYSSVQGDTAFALLSPGVEPPTPTQKPSPTPTSTPTPKAHLYLPFLENNK